MHAHMKNYVNMKYFMNHILIQFSPNNETYKYWKKLNAKKSTIIERQTYFFPTHIQGLNPMMPLPKKKKRITINQKRKHQNKVYNTSSNKMLTLDIGVVEKKQNRMGVKLTIGRRERFYLAVFSFTNYLSLWMQNK